VLRDPGEKAGKKFDVDRKAGNHEAQPGGPLGACHWKKLFEIMLFGGFWCILRILISITNVLFSLTI
jgi:hypothetical protein